VRNLRGAFDWMTYRMRSLDGGHDSLIMSYTQDWDADSGDHVWTDKWNVYLCSLLQGFVSIHLAHEKKSGSITCAMTTRGGLRIRGI